MAVPLFCFLANPDKAIDTLKPDVDAKAETMRAAKRAGDIKELVASSSRPAPLEKVSCSHIEVEPPGIRRTPVRQYR